MKHNLLICLISFLLGSLFTYEGPTIFFLIKGPSKQALVSEVLSLMNLDDPNASIAIKYLRVARSTVEREQPTVQTILRDQKFMDSFLVRNKSALDEIDKGFREYITEKFSSLSNVELFKYSQFLKGDVQKKINAIRSQQQPGEKFDAESQIQLLMGLLSKDVAEWSAKKVQPRIDSWLNDTEGH